MERLICFVMGHDYDNSLFKQDLEGSNVKWQNFVLAVVKSWRMMRYSAQSVVPNVVQASLLIQGGIVVSRM